PHRNPVTLFSPFADAALRIPLSAAEEEQAMHTTRGAVVEGIRGPALVHFVHNANYVTESGG
ncbi:MAG: hypothetical protein KGQ32_08520, partial [Xanthomonadaceae bacterium]|nr:hypothetical protein [Xanthomonadaceae bacterium]